ncbi:MAG: tetratricopeptide repeat protein [Ignavibacteria bacterium]|nr:tetratricopeptide repeat protein [Ignavibacteria bacterium]
MNNEELIALLTQADEHKNTGNNSEAEKLANEVLVIAERNSLLDIQSKANNILGIVNRKLGKYDKSFDYFSKALADYEILGDKKSIGGVMINIGNLFNNLGSYDKSLEFFAKAIPILEEIGEIVFKANAMMGIGNAYLHLLIYDKSLHYYFKALATSEEIENKSCIAYATGCIGNLYFHLHNYDKALEFYSKTLAYFEELGYKDAVALYRENIAGVYASRGSYDKALEYFLKALSIKRELGIMQPVALSMENIGLIYSEQNFTGYNVEQAEEYFLESIALSEEIGAKRNIYTTCRSLAKLYKAEKRWEECALYFEKFYTVEKEVQSEEAQKQAEQMEYRRKIEESERDRQVKLARFQEQEKILHNILPSQIADRMIDGEKTIADSHENVSVFFSDIVGFTKLSQRVSAEELVGMLNGIFSQFDQLARKHGLEKIKTIGDAYMAVCGAPIHVDNHAERTALFALDVAELMNNYQTNTGDNVMIRIGLHSGSVVAGIIGENKFAYDMWGDAVNTASRMESHGEAGKIHVSEEFKQALQKGPGLSPESPKSPKSPKSLHFQARGELDIKGKGSMNTYFLERAI